jgi:hypothetical protein|tara:strand:- start:1479 stop:1727 length:249 start_codon:yes stop_codon:yes gene_type:complete
MKEEHWTERQIELVYTEVKHLKEENQRLHHLTNILVEHLWKVNNNGLPLKSIDRQMKLFDEQTELLKQKPKAYRDVLSGEEI